MRIITVLGLYLATISLSLSLQAATPPNIILYVTDDQGLETVGIYGGENIATPNLDKLATAGAYFTNAFASASSCTVSRGNLLSGKHGHVNGLYGHEHLYNHFSSFSDIKSLPVLLKRANYRTARIGKYHVAPESVYKFDKVFPNASPETGNAYGRSLIEMADVVMDFATQDRKQPFFLYMCPNDPHRSSPHLPDKPNNFGNQPGGYPGVKRVRISAKNAVVPNYLPDIPEVRAELVEFYESISRIDQGFGHLMKNLKDAGLYDNTVIIFLSDNGTPMPNAKTTLYDTGIRLPLIVKAPGQKAQGAINEAMVSWIDIAPTLLDYAGVDTSDVKFNGKSFRSVLEGGPADDFGEVYGSHTFHEVTMYYPMRMIRTHNYKLIWNIAHPLEYPTGWHVWEGSVNAAIRNRNIKYLGKRKTKAYKHRPQFELYDLKKDPLEINNVADKKAYQETLEALKTKLFAFQKSTNDPWAIKLKHE